MNGADPLTQRATPRGQAAHWLRVPRRRRRARLRLVCCPHAGGAARFFYPWLRALPSSVELMAVQYPGRDDRLDEPVLDRMDQLVEPLTEALAEVADVPLVLFGHSMGASVAFEAARRLADQAPGAVRQLFVSARPAPFFTDTSQVHLSDDEGLISELRRLGGTDTALFGDQSLRATLLPAVRGDYRLIERYRYRPGPPLDCPVTAVVGTLDPGVSTERAEGWRSCTTSTFTLRALRGGHFYLNDRRDELIAYLLTSLGLRGDRAGWPSTP